MCVCVCVYAFVHIYLCIFLRLFLFIYVSLFISICVCFYPSRISLDFSIFSLFPISPPPLSLYIYVHIFCLFTCACSHLSRMYVSMFLFITSWNPISTPVRNQRFKYFCFDFQLSIFIYANLVLVCVLIRPVSIN